MLAARTVVTNSEAIVGSQSMIMEREDMNSVGGGGGEGMEFDSQSLVPSSWSVCDSHALALDGVGDPGGRLLVTDVDGQHCLVGSHSLVTDAGGHLLVSDDGHSLVRSDRVHSPTVDDVDRLLDNGDILDNIHGH